MLLLPFRPWFERKPLSPLSIESCYKNKKRVTTPARLWREIRKTREIKKRWDSFLIFVFFVFFVVKLFNRLNEVAGVIADG